MNSRNRVKDVFEGRKIDRFPMWYGADPQTTENVAKHLGVDGEESVLRHLGIDFRTIRPRYIGPTLAKYPDGSFETVWGIRRGGLYYGHALNHPLEDAKTIKEIERYRWPDPEDWTVSHTLDEIDQYEGYCLIGGDWSPFFHDVAELFGMETLFTNMFYNPKVVEAAIEHCIAFYLETSQNMFELAGDKLDIFFFGNDFGSQKSLLFSPEMWRRFFRQPLKKFIELGDHYGLKTVLHSCGSVYEIIPDLIDMGLNGLNPIQISAANMAPEKLQQEFGKNLVFFGGIDVQTLLTFGTEKQVRKETRRIISVLGANRKYILAPAHDYLLPEVPPENIVAMYDESLTLGS